jgi:phenylacetic acid degradation operon negative regulatory protein
VGEIVKDSSWPTTQAIVFTILGMYCLESNPPISTNAYITILERLDISAHATRLTLSRMAKRGYLLRHRKGRSVYWTATDTMLDVVRGQRQRTFAEAKDVVGPDGPWTVLCFSIPEARRGDRDLLRRRLAWEGFGLLRDGVWIAPGERDLGRILDFDDVDGVGQFVDSFTAYPHATDLKDMIARAWHLAEMRERYDQFLGDWDGTCPPQVASDPLGRSLLLVTCWRQLVRETPRLPDQYLPPGWSAGRCAEVFQKIFAEDESEANAAFRGIIAAQPG